MAVNKTGIAQLFESFDGSTPQTNNPFDISPKIGDFTVARVKDININSNSSLFPETGQWSGIGTIDYSPVKSSANQSSDSGVLQLATPLFPNIKNYPLINEYVLIVKGPSNINPGIGSELKDYYINISLWNNQHSNAFPPDLDNDNTISPSLDKSNTSIEAGNVQRPSTQKQSIDLNGNSGGLFEEKGDIQPILSFAGDHILEGRFGNSIRLGNTAKSNGILKNNWSEGNNTENGDPIIILKNGQPKNNDPGFLPITEDINVDPTSIYLTSTQKLPIDISVAQKNEGEESTIPYSNIIKSTPKSPKSFNQPQIILNSGRLLFNTHTDSILFSSKKSIVLTSIEDLGIQSQTKNINLISDKGIISLGKQNASESAILGDSFITDFQALVDGLKTLCSALSKESSIPIASSLANIMSQADSVLDNISNRAKAGVYNSNKVKVS